MHGLVVLWVLTPEASLSVNEAVGGDEITDARVGNLEIEVFGFHNQAFNSVILMPPE